jgi:integrase
MSLCNTMTTSALVAKDCATWSHNDQQAWKAKFDPTISRRRRAPWVRQTQYQNAGVFTRYLECAAKNGLAADLHPEGVRAFVRQSHADGCSMITISGYAWAIWKVLRMTRPAQLAQYEWFYETCCKFADHAKITGKIGAHRKVDSADLAVAGERLIHAAREMAGIAAADIPDLVARSIRGELLAGDRRLPWLALQYFRDGLFLLVGAYAPERRRALVSITLDQIDLQACEIVFDPRQIKTKRRSDRPLPAFVMDLVIEWIILWRSQYRPGHQMLWIAKGGKAVKDEAMYAAMVKATKRVLGFPVSPHDFRDAAATLTVEEAPQRPRLATIMLGHSSEEMTRNYTEQANQITACRKLAGALARTREAVAQEVRSMTTSTIALNPRSQRLGQRRLKN